MKTVALCLLLCFGAEAKPHPMVWLNRHHKIKTTLEVITVGAICAGGVYAKIRYGS